MIIGAYMDTGGCGVGGFEIWRLWVPLRLGLVRLVAALADLKFGLYESYP